MKEDMNDVVKAVDEVRDELLSAMDRFAPMPTPHDGWAVIYEEVDELWEEVRRYKANAPETENVARMRKEAMQVAAMSLRFMVDLTEATLPSSAEPVDEHKPCTCGVCQECNRARSHE